MDANKLEGLLIDYIDGKLSETERLEVERELAANPGSLKVYEQLQEVLSAIDQSAEMEPPQRLKQDFAEALRKEMESLDNSSPVKRHFLSQPVIYRIAAGVALLICGIAIGFWINREAEVQALRKEMEATRQIMMAMLDNTESASKRMMGVTVAFKMEKTDDQIVQALAKAMNEDRNTNVRLAALEALGKFHQQENVRKVLVASLATQKDPMVQIALIRLMVEMKEKDAMKDLERISRDEKVLPAVKDEAHAGILKLS